MALGNILFSEHQEEIQFFLCGIDESISKRICAALQIAAGVTKCKTIQIGKIDNLMSSDVSSKDFLIINKLCVQEFAVTQVVGLLEESPKIIWISSEEKISLSNLINEIQATA